MHKCFITILLITILGDYAAAGTIVGQVTLTPSRQTAAPVNRYTGRDVVDSAKDREDGAAAAVVYLVGGPGAGIAPPQEHPQMVQIGQSFDPEVLPVLVGTTVDFPNLDPVFHNVFSYSKTKKFDLGRYPKGHSKSVTFDTPGVVKVFCEIHSSMRAHILVLDLPYFSSVSSDGQFRIPNVPAGEYTLKVWQEQAPESEMPVTVPAADSIVVNVK